MGKSQPTCWGVKGGSGSAAGMSLTASPNQLHPFFVCLDSLKLLGTRPVAEALKAEGWNSSMTSLLNEKQFRC